MPSLVALTVCIYHGLPKTPQLCLLISLTLARRFKCLRSGSSVTAFLVYVELSKRVWASPKSAMRLRLVYP